jgi:hypothetical protein
MVDDIAVMADTPNALALSAARIARDLKTAGLHLGHGSIGEKDGYMNIPDKQGNEDARKTLEDLGIKETSSFKYLGTTTYNSQSAQKTHMEGNILSMTQQATHIDI